MRSTPIRLAMLGLLLALTSPALGQQIRLPSGPDPVPVSTAGAAVPDGPTSSSATQPPPANPSPPATPSPPTYVVPLSRDSPARADEPQRSAGVGPSTPNGAGAKRTRELRGRVVSERERRRNAQIATRLKAERAQRAEAAADRLHRERALLSERVAEEEALASKAARDASRGPRVPLLAWLLGGVIVVAAIAAIPVVRHRRAPARVGRSRSVARS